MKYLTLFFISLIFLASCTKKQNDQAVKKTKNPFYEKAIALQYERDELDSAFIYYNKAKELFLQKKDSIGVGKSLTNMGIILTDKGDHFGSLETSLEADTYFKKNKKKDFPYLQANYNTLGMASSSLKNYKQAITFFRQSLNYTKDSAIIFIVRNNLANAYRDNKEYNKALSIYNLVLTQHIKDNQTYARLLTNKTVARWLQQPTYNAAPNLLKALHIREQEQDLWGQNSSYDHLSDYYVQKKPDSALIYARYRYHIAQKINSPDDRLDALKQLIKIAPLSETKSYFEIYRSLNDSVQTARNAAKNQFALIRYETEKSKAENLNLQKDNTEKKYQIIKREILLYSSLFLLIAGTLIGINWYKKRKRRIELEAENAIRAHELKTSKKVHDVVANGLYRMMTEIENLGMDQEIVLDKIEDLYEKSRDISYDKPEQSGQEFNEKISALIKSFATDHTKVVLVGNSATLWKPVSSNVKYEIEHILQELLVNMRKHSSASNVILKFETKFDEVFIYYTDNGIGLPEQPHFNNGLKNTGNRIESIKGAITFDTKAEKGLKIQISFPIS